MGQYFKRGEPVPARDSSSENHKRRLVREDEHTSLDKNYFRLTQCLPKEARDLGNHEMRSNQEERHNYCSV